MKMQSFIIEKNELIEKGQVFLSEVDWRNDD
jgi:hypothetical protein